MSSNMWKTILQLDWFYWIGGIVALFTIIGWLRWAYKKKFKPKPFHQLATTHFTAHDVLNGIERVVENARGFEPDEIVGINRGGAIVGGIIGKDLGLVPRIILVDANNGKLWFDNVEELKGYRVLLVDDRLTDGEHMAMAYDFLKRHADDVRKLVFTWIKKTNTVATPDFWAYEASSENLLFPWEPSGGSKQINFTNRSNSRATA